MDITEEDIDQWINVWIVSRQLYSIESVIIKRILYCVMLQRLPY